MEVHFPKGKYASKKVAGTTPHTHIWGLPSCNFNNKSFYLPFFVLNPKHLGFMQCMGSSFHDGSEFSHAMFVWFELLSAKERSSNWHTSKGRKMKYFRSSDYLVSNRV